MLQMLVISPYIDIVMTLGRGWDVPLGDFRESVLWSGGRWLRDDF